MSMDDGQILEMLKTGKRSGMSALFDRYYKPLVLFADTYLHDMLVAEDVVQEQFVKFWEDELHERLHERALSTFLFTMVKNASMNQLVRRGVKTEYLDLPHYLIAQEEARELDEAAVELVLKALQGLPDKTRVVVEHVMLKGRMYKEAAEELNISVNTVKTLLKLGIKELRVSLKDRQELIFLFMVKYG